ncbi:malto-oligosyltrehalose synthase [Pedobacter sp.]|uniref:malto-oligosyltrehalose synthase n=1 Tax=Pedobacter sp. TaxID=1411316 RepID=UPI0031E36DCC
MYLPKSTYRIQFHKDFNFADLDRAIPYLIELGIDTLYASPIFQAMPSSTHGYDIVNPLRINPEIGTEEELFAVSKKLKQAGIGWLQDIVPNHMAFHPDNTWLMDVLEKGRESAFADYFDIDWAQGDGRLMVPFLGNNINQAVEEGSLSLQKQNGKYFLHTGSGNWPLNSKSSGRLSKINNGGKLKDKALILALANEQFYRLCHWQETSANINYRRFFTVNSLICLNIQHTKVFDHYHSYIFRLIKEGVFQGLRIDHVDGLYDPEQYLSRLRRAVGQKVYIVVEKILEKGEHLPESWAIQGNSGYDFLSVVNNLFTDRSSQNKMDSLYLKVTGKKQDPGRLSYEKKSYILHEHMAGELNNLCALFHELKLVPETVSDGAEIKRAIAQLLIRMPVYRFYTYGFPLNPDLYREIETITGPMLNEPQFRQEGLLLRKILLDKPAEGNQPYNRRVAKFFQRCMQFTGPLMAKGVEDTLMFTFNRFIAHNEVGDSAGAFGIGIDAFHNDMVRRQLQWPFSMNATTTHDTKRGEDVRARLNVLSDMPDEWAAFVGGMQQLMAQHREFEGLHKNDVYLLMQTLTGALPFPGEDGDEIGSRMKEFVPKALREAKKRSDWAAPNQDYETRLAGLSELLHDPHSDCGMLLQGFLRQIADFAVMNSLAQLILKFTCPGVPDCYQGSELWELSLVDPDNRRPVDYKKRLKILKEADTRTFSELWQERFSGGIKLRLVRALMELRKTHAQLFSQGAYLPISVKGVYAAHICAFARRFNSQWILVAVPLGLAKLSKKQGCGVLDLDWKDTRLILPPGAPLSWKDLLNGQSGHQDILSDGLGISELFAQHPFALISLQASLPKRNAGILMHISCLPGDFGIGDLGPAAFGFVDFLHQARQRYWQILPLNPVSAENGFSPYASHSSSAGNILLISPEVLLNDGLLKPSDLDACRFKAGSVVDFEQVLNQKNAMLEKAYRYFLDGDFKPLKQQFTAFCSAEEDWLHTFALHQVLSRQLNCKAWYRWPAPYKYRKARAIAHFSKKHESEIEEVKWQQFIFFKQWEDLRQYAKRKGVAFIGDLPFYPDYAAHELWEEPLLFKLGKDLEPLAVAGVPPDYFNAQGQLWGMPVFDWEKMKQEKYGWWIRRISKSLERFDLLRLDHFRAFSEYWSVPAGQTSAVKGKWLNGPGEDFFKQLRQELGELPLIAEDLGEESAGVNALLNQFKLPGMKVLQFAFNSTLPSSPHAPHNFENSACIAYSGTHDNNTAKGWFNQQASPEEIERLSLYAGERITLKNVHQAMAKLTYASVAQTAILPIQDILGLDERARMNIPGEAKGNWAWKLQTKVSGSLAEQLKKLTELFGRADPAD